MFLTAAPSNCWTISPTLQRRLSVALPHWHVMPSDKPTLHPGAMTLYGDLISPYVRTCLVIAHELGIGGRINLQPAEVPIASVNDRLAAFSPIAQVPVLVTADGTVIHDSRVVVDYLCRLERNTGLLPSGGDMRLRVMTLQAIGLGMADAAVAYRNEVAQRPPQLHWEAWWTGSNDASRCRWTL